MEAVGVQRRSRLQVFTVLQHPSFRRYWSGLAMSVLGLQIMVVAQGWLVYDLTESKLYLGYVGLAMGLPAILLNLLGGVVADKVDQRRLLIITQSVTSLAVFVLATLTLAGVVVVWHILLTAFIIGSVQAFDSPTRQAILPHLIDRTNMLQAVALNSMVWQGTRVVGPALGGLIIGTRLGVAPGFYVAFLGFLFMAIMVSTLKLPPIRRNQDTTVLQDMAKGLNFIRSNNIFAFLIGMTFFNSIFGMSYLFLLPVFAKDILMTGPEGLGYLHTASGVGAVFGTLVTISLGNIRWKGWLLLAGAVLFGIFLILFAATSAITGSFPMALVLLSLVGLSTSIYMVLVISTLQIMVPDELRGRVMGIYGMTWSMLPLGGMQAGAIAEYTSAPFAVGLGGAIVILFAVGMACFSRQARHLGTTAS